ncbi:MAG: hypothetical protein QOG00_267 [Pyrinomonadaceae bacterium]|nr:hypothetical protein [Pyrinomonadaceae bacterium]
MSFTDNYASFQGKLYLAKRSSAGVNQAFRYLGNVPAGELALNVERRKHQESTTGKRLVDKIQTTTKAGRVKLTLEDIHKKNVALCFGGANVTLASGSYSGSNYDTFASGLVVGDIVKLTKPVASSIVVKDSAGSPATLVLNTDYKILDAKHGLIEILSLGSYTQPFRAQYSYAQTEAVTAYEAGDDDEYFLYCALVNTEASPDQAIGIEIYRIVFDPAAATQLINNEQGSFPIEAEVLRDSTRADDTNYGGFFRWLFNDANA